MLKDLILKNRSYRRFNNSIPITKDTLIELIDLARLSPSAMNAQQIKYVISNTSELNNSIYETLNWAGYLTDWNGPLPEERPSAYIVLVHDTSIHTNLFWDIGIACQSILLGAVEKELGGCQFGSFNDSKLRTILNLEDNLIIKAVIALGKPIEEVIITKLEDCHKYYRDEKMVHYVPKRSVDDIVIDIKKT